MLKVTKKVSLVKFDLPGELSPDVRSTQVAAAKSGLDDILERCSGQIQFEPIYRSVELLCRYGQSQLLHQLVRDGLIAHCRSMFVRMQEALHSCRIPLAEWLDFTHRLDAIQSAFACLLILHRKPSSDDFVVDAIRIFVKYSLGDDGMSKLSTSCIKLIGVGNAQVPSGLLQMLDSVGLLDQLLVASVLPAVDSLQLEENLSDACAVFEGHINGFGRLMPSESYLARYVEIWKTSYLSKYKNIVGGQMLLAVQRNWLGEFRACQSICSDLEFEAHFRSMVCSLYKSFCSEHDRPDKIMQRTIELKCLLHQWLPSSKFLLRRAFEAAFATNPVGSGSQLAFWFDSILREPGIVSIGLQKKERQVDDRMMCLDEAASHNAECLHTDGSKYQHGLEAFVWIPSKEHFELVHRRLLIRRMVQAMHHRLPEKSQAELAIVDQLDRIAGHHLTTRLRGLLRDWDNEDSRLHRETGVCLVLADVVFPVPLNPDVDKDACTFSDPLKSVIEEFRDEFKDKFPKRRFMLSPTLSTVCIDIKADHRILRLTLTLPQAAILLALGEKPVGHAVPLNDVKASCGILSEGLLKRALHSLTSSNMPLLVVDSQKQTICLNPNLSAIPDCRINLYSSKELIAHDSQPAKTFSSEASGSFLGTLIVDEANLGNQLDAFLVRTLKSNRELAMTELRAKAFVQLGISDDFFKARMQSLSERDFLSIDGENVTYKA